MLDWSCGVSRHFHTEISHWCLTLGSLKKLCFDAGATPVQKSTTFDKYPPTPPFGISYIQQSTFSWSSKSLKTYKSLICKCTPGSESFIADIAKKKLQIDVGTKQNYSITNCSTWCSSVKSPLLFIWYIHNVLKSHSRLANNWGSKMI